MCVRLVWFALTVALLAAVGTAAASEGEAIPAGLRELEGHWQYAGGEQERQARLDAIDHTVQQMSFFIRFIARRMIRESTAIPSSYFISIHDHAIVVREDHDPGVATGWDGKPVKISGHDGSSATVTRTWEDGSLHSRVQEAKGSGTEIMWPEDGGQKMTIKMVVASSHLPSDITFTLTYRKVSDGQAPQ